MKGLAFILAICVAAALPAPVDAQTAPPVGDITQKEIDELEMKNSKEFKDTEAFIKQTQSKLDLVRTQTEARAKEIEALADRVGDIISTMSSKDEDNSNLRSELSVSTELLSIERSTTGGLREEKARMLDQIEAEKAARKNTESLLNKKIMAMNTELVEKEKKLFAALQSVAALTKSKKSLEFDLTVLKIRMGQLEKDAALKDRRRSRSTRQPRRPPPRINP